MSFEQLLDFIQHRMNLAQTGEPVMLAELLCRGGECSSRDIAVALMNHDQGQLDYYRAFTDAQPGKDLMDQRIVENEDGTYRLAGYDKLSEHQIQDLISACDQQLAKLTYNRAGQKPAGDISGNLRYEVLKRAGFHCELCGAAASQKALSVSRIIPLDAGGTDEINNLQALCLDCSALSRAPDSADFNSLREGFLLRAEGCPFCSVESDRVLLENELAYSIPDKFPVTPSHTLVVPKRHAATWFDLFQSEINACSQLVKAMKNRIEAQDPSVEGFNIGINSGATAGQTIPHCHIHLIPRRPGDVEDPRGGVRHIIPGKGLYPGMI